jgi:hypothetical protein
VSVRRLIATFTVPAAVVAFALSSSLATAGQPPAPPVAPITAGDIVFVIDESGSMADEIADVVKRTKELVTTASARFDARFALVGFGGAPPRQTPELPYALTHLTDASHFLESLGGVGAFPGSGQEVGLYATTYALTQVGGFRAGSGRCVILISDEDPDPFRTIRVDLAEARNQLAAQSAAWFGIIPTGVASTRATYGPSAGSLSATSGGEVFDINDFRRDPTKVLQTVVSRCAGKISERAAGAAFTAVPSSGEVPLTVRFEATRSDGISSYEWAFGDGSTSTEPGVVHVYGRVGIYTATLGVTSVTGEKATATIKIRVRAKGKPYIGVSDCTKLGTAAADLLVGTGAHDVLCGFGGNDTLRGAGGYDVLVGGAGGDKLKGGPGNDRLFGGIGPDSEHGNGGSDVVTGNDGRDALWGDGGNDRVVGGRGADRLHGGPGGDHLLGGLGDDKLAGDNGRNVLSGGPGRDTLIGGGAQDTATGIEMFRNR